MSHHISYSIKSGLSWYRAKVSLVLITLGLLVFVASCSRSPQIAPASDEATIALKQMQVPPGFKIELFAAEPLLANPVSFSIDGKGQFYVAETFRLMDGVMDNRNRRAWVEPEILAQRGERAVRIEILNEELGSQSVEDNINMLKKHFGNRAKTLSGQSERVRLIYPGKDGKAARSVVFADGFDQIGQGIGAGVLVRDGKVWYTCIPDLWLLQDTKGSGHADKKISLQHGFGVRVGYAGHDLHGLTMGPEGKLYFSIGDRGANLRTKEGRSITNLEMGAVYRCNPDGSELELFASGLRNPQELAFDQYGNLWTGDNNSDGGDLARLVYVVEGGDSGWRVGYQYLEWPEDRGPWMTENLCTPQFPGQAAYIVPPIAELGNGPAGLTYYPGTGFREEFKGHFFLCDWQGVASASSVLSFATKPKGASFEIVDRQDFMKGLVATDVEFGPDGAMYVLDWGDGIVKKGKGRIYRVLDSTRLDESTVQETKKILAEGMQDRPVAQLASYLSHPDQRVRQQAQFALADAGMASIDTLMEIALRGEKPLARIHAIWGIGQILSKFHPAPATTKEAVIRKMLPLIRDTNAEVRIQCAKVLGEARCVEAYEGLVSLLGRQEDQRGQFFAAMALGKLGKKEAVKPILEMLRSGAGEDPYLRHAAVMALIWLGNFDALFEAGKDSSRSVRMAALVALRRLGRPEVVSFLHDSDPQVVLEAARAINDESIYSGLPQLAALVSQTNLSTLSTNVEPILRRAVNANLRLGTSGAARALADFAARPDVPEVPRIEALRALGQWEKPFGRDVVTGLWRPMPARNPEPARQAISPRFAEILSTAPDSVRVEATALAERLGLKEVDSILYDLFVDSKSAVALRVGALKVLTMTNTPKASEMVQIAIKDSNELLRIEATKIQVFKDPTNAAQMLTHILENGTLREKQNALTILGIAKVPFAEKIICEWLDGLASGKVAGELQLDLLESASRSANPEVRKKLQTYQAGKEQAGGISAYSEALAGGDAAEGRAVFFQVPEASCVRCHKVGGQGGEMGPDLTGIGSRATRDFILESILYPNKKTAEGFESTNLTMKDGEVISGIVKSENAEEIILISKENATIKVRKDQIKDRQKGLSAMPEDLGKILSRRNLRNLVDFLANSK